MVWLGNRERKVNREAVLTDYSKRRLLTYADSFKELAAGLSFTYREDGEDRQQVLERRRLWEKQQVICKNMNEMSNILCGVAAEAFQLESIPDRKYRRVIQALHQERLCVKDLFFMQSHTAAKETRPVLAVRMYATKSSGIRTDEVADMLSVLLDHCFVASATCPYMVDKEEKYYFFVEEPVFMVMPGYARAIRENESVSGDNYALIESVKGQMTVLLSDGMGSGEKACEDSETVLDLMEKMLEAGYDVDTAMSLVNSTLAVSEASYNMSTLDVCNIDLYSGMCRFRKMGAAATFLKSNAYVEQIQINSLPLGVFQSRDSEAVTRELIENDYIIMMSDGITDALAMAGSEELLSSYLADLRETNPGEMAKKILQLALMHSNGRIMDDMTVVVLGIFRVR
ncbi:MAG: SpoIIE family protein phosphatase [Lachnospiraceae bacterium]|nr:SpoIIE family protein phosphatase [Lachnospiraceae bacterium]